MMRYTVKHILQVCGFAWLFSVSLGFFFAIVAFQGNPFVLLLPAVIPVAVLGSTVAVLPILPIAVWASRTGWPNIRRYGIALWLLLAAYCAVVIPFIGRPALLSLVLVAAVGVFAIGFIPPQQ